MPDLKKQKVLLSGAKGMLGRVIETCLSSKGYDVKGFDLDEGDICDTPWLEEQFLVWKPDIFCNCAAYTKVDEAEKNRPLAFSVNGDALKGIMALCVRTGSVLVHFSTDYVFDGTKNSPYQESDQPNPQSVYGKSKWEGEKVILSHQWQYDRFYIIRTSWLHGLHGPNFVSTILDLAQKKKDLDVVADQKGTPTFCEDLAEGVYQLLRSRRFGLFHFSGEGSCSWYELALATIEMARKRDLPLRVKHIHPVTTEQFKRQAPRPPFSVMDKKKYKETTGQKVPHWLDSLEKFIISKVSDPETQYRI
jgi:dTDP-4-dehydrorhamnose reductase